MDNSETQSLQITSRDPRVVRTRAHVLSHARALLSAGGPNQVTYQELAARAQVTRQTLYRHWPTRESLFADLALESTAWSPTSTGPPELIIKQFLHSLRDGMDDPRNAAPLTALIALADHDVACRNALARVAAEGRAALNRALAPSGVHLGAEQYACLLGPVLFHRFLSREPVPDQLIDQLASNWSTPADGRP